MTLARETEITITTTLTFDEWTDVMAVAEAAVMMSQKVADEQGHLPADIKKMNDNVGKFTSAVISSMNDQYGDEAMDRILGKGDE